VRPILLGVLFLALGFGGWSASGIPIDRAGFVWLDVTTTPDPTTDTTGTTGTTSTTSTDTTTPTTTTTDSSSTTTTTPVDNPPSFQNVPANVTVEANGPSGSAVNYTVPTAVDDQDGPRPVACSPESGSVFPLGDTTVTCTATDSGGNTAQATFPVTVRDTTPPSLVVPADHSIYATSALGVSDSDPGVIAFVQAASATDIVDPQPVVGSDLHSFLPVGVTVIRFFARDFSGNVTGRESRLTVVPPPTAGTPPLPLPPPVVASIPPNVAKLSLAPLDGALRLTWQTGADCDHVVVTRSNSNGSADQVVYSGNGNSFTDQGLENGVEYRYVIRCVDAAGNRSAGVAIVAVPRRNMLRSPKDGAQLRKPPKLAWASDATADYYNLQLLRNGVRIFVSWPTKTSFTLKKSWTYQGRGYTLSAGRYDWYVWPGFGPRQDVNYGTLLGARSFRIRP
jgi:fibronectin type 3 domain-containing protein